MGWRPATRPTVGTVRTVRTIPFATQQPGNRGLPSFKWERPRFLATHLRSSGSGRTLDLRKVEVIWSNRRHFLETGPFRHMSENDMIPESIHESRQVTTPGGKLWEQISRGLREQRHRRVVQQLPPAQRLAQLRRSCGFSQEQLAARLGTNQARLSKMERRSSPRIDWLEKYVEALGGSLHVLVRFPTRDSRLYFRSPSASAVCGYLSGASLGGLEPCRTAPRTGR